MADCVVPVLALLIALGINHGWRVVPPPAPIGVTIFSRIIEGRVMTIQRLPDGDCLVRLDGVAQYPLDPATTCVL